MQVYLPDDLYAEVKNRGLAASELLQRAVRDEVRRLELLEATDRHVARLAEEVTPPTPAERDRATVIVQRVGRRARR
jgi:hypothetical protein